MLDHTAWLTGPLTSLLIKGYEFRDRSRLLSAPSATRLPCTRVHTVHTAAALAAGLLCMIWALDDDAVTTRCTLYAKYVGGRSSTAIVAAKVICRSGCSIVPVSSVSGSLVWLLDSLNLELRDVSNSKITNAASKLTYCKATSRGERTFNPAGLKTESFASRMICSARSSSCHCQMSRLDKRMNPTHLFKMTGTPEQTRPPG